MLTPEEREFLLTPKALPTSTHGVNLRAALKPSQWNKIRQQVYERANHMCEVCNAKTRLEAHEMWEFDFANQLQVLKRLVALCVHCHRLQHMMLLSFQVSKGLAALTPTLIHYNRLTKSYLTGDQFFAKAAQEAAKYEKIEWQIVLSDNLF